MTKDVISQPLPAPLPGTSNGSTASTTTIDEVKRLGGMSVIIAEDTWHTAISLRRLIESAGGRVAAMSSNLADLKLKSAVACDAIIMDLNLNGQIAIELAGQLAASGKKVIVLSGYRRPAALDGRVHAFLEKPCLPEQLFTALLAPVRPPQVRPPQ